MAIIYNNSSYLCVLTEIGSAESSLALFQSCISVKWEIPLWNQIYKCSLIKKEKQKTKLNTRYYPNFTICMTNLDSILKSRDSTLLTKVHLVKAKVFPVVIYGCESWTIQIAEHRKIDAFELWWWRRLLRVPWTGRRSNQSILKEISLEYSLEGMMLKLRL